MKNGERSGNGWLWPSTLVMLLLSGVAAWPLCICLSDFLDWRLSAVELAAAFAVFFPFALLPFAGYVQSLRAGTMSKYLPRIAAAVVVLAAVNAGLVFCAKTCEIGEGPVMTVFGVAEPVCCFFLGRRLFFRRRTPE